MIPSRFSSTAKNDETFEKYSTVGKDYFYVWLQVGCLLFYCYGGIRVIFSYIETLGLASGRNIIISAGENR